MANIFTTPAKILSGINALSTAGSEFANMGKKALVVSDGMMHKLGNIRKLEEVLISNNIQYSLFAEVNTEPTDVVVKAGVAQYCKENCDFLIAIGGGSPIDTMKAIAVLVSVGGKLVDYMGKDISNRLPKIAAVPTTAGTGSEATQVTIIIDTETQVKMMLRGGALMPDLAVMDPQFTITAPPDVTAATGIDALCHAVEAYTSKRAQPLSDIFALSATKRILDHLLKAYDEPENVEARTQMVLAATEAGIAFNNASVAIIHGMSRPIGALFHVPHGISNAMLMETCLDFVKHAAVEQFADLARHCGLSTSYDSDEEAADKFLIKITLLLRNLNIPTLREYGIDPETFNAAIPKMASDAFASGSPSNTHFDITISHIEQLYAKLILK